jgi:hypothetical protein
MAASDLAVVFARDPLAAHLQILRDAGGPVAWHDFPRILGDAGVARSRAVAAWGAVKVRLAGHPRVVAAGVPTTFQWRAEPAASSTTPPAVPPGPPVDLQGLLESQRRQARIDGLRAAVALLTELQSYRPGPREPRELWEDLSEGAAADHGLSAFGRPGETVDYDPLIHELIGEDQGELRVLRAGYTWTHGDETVVLQRARVRSYG